MVWPAIIAGVASLAGGLVAQQGAKDTNIASAKAAQKQMDFQERMRSTQYQTAMADMRSAGLNPILAYKQGGAGTPGGSTYSPVNVGAAAVQGAATTANSANAMRQMRLQEEKISSEIQVLWDTARAQRGAAGLSEQKDKNALLEGSILFEQLKIEKANANNAKIMHDFRMTPAGRLLYQIELGKRAIPRLPIRPVRPNRSRRR